MGAFGFGPFENDDALDLVSEVGLDGADAVDDALDEVIQERNSDCIESDLGAKAVAAIEMIALARQEKLLRNKFVKLANISEKTAKQLATAGRVKKAIKVASIITGDNSELAQEWDDSGQGKAWRSRIQRTLKVLTKN